MAPALIINIDHIYRIAVRRIQRVAVRDTTDIIRSISESTGHMLESWELSSVELCRGAFYRWRKNRGQVVS